MNKTEMNKYKLAEILNQVIRKVSSGPVHWADIVGQPLANEVVHALQLTSSKYLIRYSDWWEAVNEPIPEDVLVLMREQPRLQGLVEWIDENGNGVW